MWFSMYLLSYVVKVEAILVKLPFLHLTIYYQTKELVLPKFNEDEENGFYVNYKLPGFKWLCAN